MAKLLPTELELATVLTDTDILITQKQGELTVRQITGANFFGDYYKQAEIDAFIAALAYGIKYNWPDTTAMLAQTGMVIYEQGVKQDDRTVYQYDGANWVALYTLDAPGTLLDTDIGVTVEAFDATILKDADIGVNIEAYDTTLLRDANIGVTVQGFDATILVDADIGVNIEAYDTTILRDADIGVTVQAYDMNNLSSADIGVTVQGYDVNTVIDAAYVQTEQNYTTIDQAKLAGIEEAATADQTKADIDALLINADTVNSFTVETAVPPSAVFTDTVYDDSTTLKDADIGVAVQAFDATILVDADIGVTVEAFDNTILRDADIGVTVQAYDMNTNTYTSAEVIKVAKIQSQFVLADGPTVAVDMGPYSQFKLSPTQNFVLGNPIGLTPGQTGYIEITQDGVGSRVMTLSSAYKTIGGLAITLTTTIGATDVLRYEVLSDSNVLVQLLADIK